MYKPVLASIYIIPMLFCLAVLHGGNKIALKRCQNQIRKLNQITIYTNLMNCVLCIDQ